MYDSTKKPSKMIKLNSTKNGSDNHSRKKKKQVKKTWDKHVKENIFIFFKNNLKMKKVPSKSECEKYILENNIADRTWKDIRNVTKKPILHQTIINIRKTVREISLYATFNK